MFSLASQGQPSVALAQNWVCGAVQFTSPRGKTEVTGLKPAICVAVVALMVLGWL